MATAPLIPPFTEETARLKVRAGENLWNSCDPEKIALAYAVDSHWRNRDEFIDGRDDIIAFLKRKWDKEQQYKLIKSMWAFSDTRIAVRFAYEWQDVKGNWYRSFGNENWEFNAQGLMTKRHASINDVQIEKEHRLFTWEGIIRPDDFPELEALGL